ncbi:hypothetical protein D5018_05975 [Parashewanella curva]|uniref:LTD domain-containing protein n=1 Tax=Parashewanella curva TaxID=2338552 RepID=A0A3L8PZ19_9GAMM|nr:Ig-like domain-containing protein [Parashewanella curva]RLV60647.1 hypothetical protein D5018_05975 [Parashewanella curva]
MGISTSKLSILTLSVLTLWGCGGGGGDDSEKSNQAPQLSHNTPVSVEERSQATLSINATDTDGSITSYLWTQTSGPTVTLSTNNTASINFIVPEVTSDTNLTFLVKVTDNESASSSQTISTKIVNVNRQPVLADASFEVEFNQAKLFLINPTDLDGDALTISIEKQPDHGTIELVDSKVNSYRYTPKTDNIQPDKATFKVSDGKLTASAIISLPMVDSTAPKVTEISPSAGAKQISETDSISLTFDDIIVFASSTPSSACDSEFQLSSDEFKTCIPLNIEFSNQRNFRLTPTTELKSGTKYQLKVNGDKVKNFAGTAAETKVISHFTTNQADLLITEISASQYLNDNRWIELYNGTNNDINLSDYTIHTQSVNLDANETSLSDYFQLPDRIVKAGQRIIIQGRFKNGTFQNSNAESDQLVIIGNSNDNIRPYWSDSGYLELLNSQRTQTVDFVRFGNLTQEPMTQDAWLGIAIPPMERTLGYSLVRNIDDSDTNTASDWNIAKFATPAGINDVTNCTEDIDVDGIPDCAEVENSTFAGLPLYQWGARKNQKDIFIEVDYMQSNDAGVIPHQTALKKVVDAFKGKNYHVHFDVGNLYHNADGISPESMDLGGGNEITFYKQTLFTPRDGAPSLIEHKVKNFDVRRKPIFHYMLMANSQKADGSAGSSGVAEIDGNDFLISMGGWGLNLSNEPSKNRTYNMQASTIMHELGHNLGLLHGGNENTNYKPNFLSVMNYLYQLDGLPTIGDREGDRYYRRFFNGNLNCNLENNQLKFGNTESPENFKIGYSSGNARDIDEAAITEDEGFGYDNSVAIDFNCNDDIDNLPYSRSINNDGSISLLRDVDEWALINLRFNRSWSGNVSGIGFNTSTVTPVNVMNDDTQPIIQEMEPPQELLQQIRALKND